MSFTLPDHVEVSIEILRAVADRHGFDGAPIQRLPETGIFNAIHQIGDGAILRVPRNHPKFIASLVGEAVAVPAAIRAGGRTPSLLAFDEALDLLPVPYTLYERVPGLPLESLDLQPDATAEIWRELGHDLARTHLGVPVAGAVVQLDGKLKRTDPRQLVQRRAEEGWLASLEAGWLIGWLDRIADAALEPTPRRFLHGDSQGTNVMVQADPLRYQAVIDWGSACLGDMARDFAGVPLRVVPAMLAGHRELAPLDGDETAEARILWRHLELGLGSLERGPVPGRSWAERPLTKLLEVLRFFADPPDGRWRKLGPREQLIDASLGCRAEPEAVRGGAGHA